MKKQSLNLSERNTQLLELGDKLLQKKESPEQIERIRNEKKRATPSVDEVFEELKGQFLAEQEVPDREEMEEIRREKDASKQHERESTQEPEQEPEQPEED